MFFYAGGSQSQKKDEIWYGRVQSPQATPEKKEEKTSLENKCWIQKDLEFLKRSVN